ncbi:phosphoenolpyruvate--protein phosphotransferase [Aeromonas sp. 164P]
MNFELAFQCALPNGLHARPASHLEAKCKNFACDIVLTNHRTCKSGSAKSSLALIGTDTLFQDECSLTFQGEQAELAYSQLKDYLENEFHLCDEPLEAVIDHNDVCLPNSLLNHTPKLIHGKPLVRGIAKGKIVKLGGIHLQSYAAEQDAHEAERFANAHQQVVNDLEQKLPTASRQEKEILTSHLSMVTDDELIAKIKTHLIHSSTANAIIATMQAYMAQFSQASSEYLRERALDIQDLGLQLLAAAYPERQSVSQELHENSIVIADELTPSQFLNLDKNYLQGLILAKASHTSHTTILARSFNIPTLINHELQQRDDLPNDDAYLDCQLGVLALEPNAGTRGYFERAMQLAKQKQGGEQVYIGQKITTLDGRAVEIAANISHPIEAQAAMLAGADGVGLFRTEMIYMDRAQAPSEEELYECYRDALIHAQGQPIIFRTMDIGGDKPLAYLNLPHENNPFLGYRAVRIYPQFLNLFHEQLRALLRASVHGKTRIMFPMINSIEEIRWVKEQLALVKQQLEQARIAVSQEIKIGIMVEIPSTAFILDHICQEVDFLSIGSNDMTQYLLAVDRDNPNVASLYDSLVPSFLRLLEQVVSNAHQYDCWVGLCGELGSDPKSLPLLIGAGLDELSMSTPAILATKAKVANLNYTQCRALFEQACACATKAEIEAILANAQLNAANKPIISRECMLLDVEYANKEEAIQAMVGNLVITGRAQDGYALENDIWAREAVFSTDLGFGFAIPHTKSEHIQHSSISMARLTKPIDWQGDAGEINFIIMLTLNSQQGNEHMKIFSALARKLMHKDFRAKLQTSTNGQEAAELLQAIIG